MRARGGSAVVGSPALVGAVTVLIVVVSMFLAYNANQGLPFVPTYDLSAVLPNGSNLVRGNEARIGGFRVGVVDRVQPRTQDANGRPQAVAVIHMKLDKTVEPLARDSTVIVRSRSSLGLKYVQITPGTSPQVYVAGDTIPLSNATAPVEIDDFLNTFSLPTRQASRGVLVGYGNALAGRGPDVNAALQTLNPFLRSLAPVMRNLSDPATRLRDLFKQVGTTTAEVAPVARTGAAVFGKMATTFAALNRCPLCLQDAIAKDPPTEDVAIRSFAAQRPFLADATDLSRRLLPAARAVRAALPRLNAALAAGTRVLPQTVVLDERTKRVFRALDDLVSRPATGLALSDLRDTLSVAKPLVNYAAPFQTVCNDTSYFTTGLGQHMSESVLNGTAERVLLKSDNGMQDNRLSNAFNDRPVDVPTGQDPKTAKAPNGEPLEIFHGGPYFPAIDAQGNADCQNGQLGFLSGPLGPTRYPPHGPVPGDDATNTKFSRMYAGGSHGVSADNSPGLAGPTFTGVPNLRAVR